MTTSKNKYYKQSHISERKFRELLRCFALDLTAHMKHPPKWHEVLHIKEGFGTLDQKPHVLLQNVRVF